MHRLCRAGSRLRTRSSLLCAVYYTSIIGTIVLSRKPRVGYKVGVGVFRENMFFFWNTYVFLGLGICLRVCGGLDEFSCDDRCCGLKCAHHRHRHYQKTIVSRMQLLGASCGCCLNKCVQHVTSRTQWPQHIYIIRV